MATQESNLDALKKELDSLKGEMKDLMDSIKDYSKSAVKDGKEKFSEQISLEELQKTMEELKGKGKEGVHYVEQNIKDEPFKSVGITLGIGFILGWLLRK